VFHAATHTYTFSPRSGVRSMSLMSASRLIHPRSYTRHTCLPCCLTNGTPARAFNQSRSSYLYNCSFCPAGGLPHPGVSSRTVLPYFTTGVYTNLGEVRCVAVHCVSRTLQLQRPTPTATSSTTATVDAHILTARRALTCCLHRPVLATTGGRW
jgi:hypothetical protein